MISRYTRWRGSKFNNEPTVCARRIRHHSKGEAMRCTELHGLEELGIIKDLEAHPQPVFALDVNGVRVCKYIADFAYTEVETGTRVVEDFKGVRTAEYTLKARLMLAVHGIEIKETGRAR